MYLIHTHVDSLRKVPLDVLQENISCGARYMLHLCPGHIVSLQEYRVLSQTSTNLTCISLL